MVYDLIIQNYKIEKVLLKKRIPDPPEDVYQLSIKDINKEIKKLTSMNQKQLDQYVKGLLKDADEI